MGRTLIEGGTAENGVSIMVRTLMSEVVVDQTDAMGKWFIICTIQSGSIILITK